MSLVRSSDDRTFRAEYEIILSGDDLGITATMVISQLGADRVRTDLNIIWEGMPSTLTTIQTPDLTAVCSSGLSPLTIFNPLPDRSCATDDATEPQTALVGAHEILAAIEDEDIDVSAADSREILGEANECFLLDDGDELHGELCVFPDGPMSYLQFDVEAEDGDAGGSTEYRLVSISHDVSESDFELPFPEQQLQELEIKNETDVEIFVNGNNADSDLIDGDIEIPPGESAKLKTGARGDPSSIYLGTYQIPQWHWACSWDDAKANEPLIVRNESANCTNTDP